MMHTNLIAHYEKVFALKQYHNWPLSELETMIPWELDVYTSLLNNFLELQDVKRREAKAK